MLRSINFHNLDALRGALAVYVVIGHCRWLLWGGHYEWLQSPHEPWEAIPAYTSALFRYGREAVMVFFALSGFFIHFRAATPSGRHDSRGAAAAFYRRRWHRLAAPYFLALVVTVSCDAVGRTFWPTLYLHRTGDALLDLAFARTGYTPESVGPALLLLPSSLGMDFGSNGPLWSLAYETVYYALYPLWLWIRRVSWSAAFIAIPLVCFGMHFVPVGGFPKFVLLHYPIWLAGALVAEHLRREAVTTRLAAIGALLFVCGATVRVLNFENILAPIAPVAFGAGAVMVLASVQARNRLAAAAEFVGVRSYTLYIVHFPFLVLLSAFVVHNYGGRPLHGWLALAGAVACVGFGCLLFEICERHFLHSRYSEEQAAP